MFYLSNLFVTEMDGCLGTGARMKDGKDEYRFLCCVYTVITMIQSKPG